MKVVIDDALQGKDLFDFLIAKKSELIAQKKALPKKCDPIGGEPAFYHVKEQGTVKTAIGEITPDADVIRAEFVANAAMWLDSQRDVLITDCWNKTIKDGNGRLHLKDHTYELDSEVGDVTDIYTKNVSLTELGVNKAGTTQCLVYVSDVQKAYDEKTFSKYKRGKINQHSIGLNYVRIQLAVNDADYKDEFATWNKYIDQIINRDDAEASGYFWAVSEIKLIEASAVVAGANRLTPTLWIGAKSDATPKSVAESEDTEPITPEQNNPQHKNIDAAQIEDSTPVEPSLDTPQEPPLPAFDLSHAIKSTQFKF